MVVSISLEKRKKRKGEVAEIGYTSIPRTL